MPNESTKNTRTWKFKNHLPEDKVSFEMLTDVLHELEEQMGPDKMVDAELFAQYRMISILIDNGKKKFEEMDGNDTWADMNARLNDFWKDDSLFFDVFEQCGTVSLEDANSARGTFGHMRAAMRVGRATGIGMRPKTHEYAEYLKHFNLQELLELEKNNKLVDPQNMWGSMGRVCALHVLKALAVNITAYYDLHKGYISVDGMTDEQAEEYRKIARLSGEAVMNAEKERIIEAERIAKEEYEKQEKERKFKEEVLARGGWFGERIEFVPWDGLQSVNDYFIQQFSMMKDELDRARNQGLLNTEALRTLDREFVEYLAKAEKENLIERNNEKVTAILVHENLNHIVDDAIKAAADLKGELNAGQRRLTAALAGLVVLMEESPIQLDKADTGRLQRFCMLKLMCAAAARGPYNAKGLVIDAYQMLSNPKYRKEQLDILMADEKVKSGFITGKKTEWLQKLAKKNGEDIFIEYIPDLNEIPLWMNEEAYERFHDTMERWDGKDGTADK